MKILVLNAIISLTTCMARIIKPKIIKFKLNEHN
jgi:hypothetical protein